MKLRHLKPLAVLLLFALPALAADVDANTKASLMATREKLWRAWFSYDLKTLQKLIPDDALGVSSARDPWVDRDATLKQSEAFTKSGAKLISLEFDQTVARRYGDAYGLYG